MQQEIQAEALNLLKKVVAKREQDLILKWSGSFNPEDRERSWFAFQELRIIVEAIKDDIREHSSSGIEPDSRTSGDWRTYKTD
jgi:hypothetical protein